MSFAKIFDINNWDLELTLSTFWVGWSSVIIFLQLWHFLAPVDIKAFLLFAIVGIACLIWNRYLLFGIFQGKFIIKLVWSLVFCSILLFIASKSIGPIIVHDSGLYHIPSIRWISAYPIIPGLGNLHNKLSFNSSYFLFLSLLDVSYWSNKSHHLGNALLGLVVLCQISISGYKLINYKSCLQVYDIMTFIFIVPIIIITTLFVSSPTPDFPLFIVGMIASVQLCRLLYSDDNYFRVAFNVFNIIIICVVGVTIKISFLFVGCLISIVALGKIVLIKENNYYLSKGKLILMILTVVIITLMPWIARNIILSGYLVYPSTFVSFDVEWKIPYQNVFHEAQWIYSGQTSATPDKVLANWDWLLPWAIQLITNRYSLVMVILPLSLAFICVNIEIVIKNKRDDVYCNIVFLIPAILSLCIWFLMAPDPRYAGASFWYLGAGTLAVVFHGTNISLFRKAGLLVFLLSVAIAVLAIILYKGTLHKKFKGNISEEGFYLIPSVEIQKSTTNSGLIVNIPKKGEQYWGAPLPAAPGVDPNLRLREGGNIKSGFMVSSKEKGK